MREERRRLGPQDEDRNATTDDEDKDKDGTPVAQAVRLSPLA